MKVNKTIAEYIVRKLEDYGVKYIFGYPGEQIIPFYEAIRKSGIEHILVRHEESAAHAADCYARITGKLGVCLATAGPGAMNLIMGVSTAYKDNTPLLVLTGDVPTTLKGQDTFQDLDINAVFKAVTRKSYYAGTPEKLENNLDEVLSLVDEGISGVYHINIPKDVQLKVMNVDHKVIKSKKIKEVSELSIEDTIKQIEKSEHPLIIIGSGIIYADATCEIKSLVEKTQIPLTTTFSARGIISEKEEINLGLIGTRANNKSTYASKNADLILAFGTRLSDRTTRHIQTDNIIQVNTNEKHQKADTFYKNNVKEFLIKLLKKDINVDTGKWLDKIHSQKEDEVCEIIEDSPIHPRLAIKHILDKMDDKTTLIMDAGTTPTYFTIDSTATKASQYIFSGGLGPMGFGLPSAIGASLARPDDTIIVAPGDGAIQMTIQELATIKQYQLPVIIIVLNNNLLGIIKQWQDMAQIPNYQVEMENPDFVKLAQAYAIEADNITTLDEFDLKLDEAIKSKKAHLFNVMIDDIPIPLP